jgi:hypothetical protein
MDAESLIIAEIGRSVLVPLRISIYSATVGAYKCA